MISLEQCRQILGAAAPDDESELRRIRDDLHELAQIFVQLLQGGEVTSRNNPLSNPNPQLQTDAAARKHWPFDTVCRAVGDETAYALIERAAIMEYDGDLERRDAEVAALEDWLSSTEH